MRVLVPLDGSPISETLLAHVRPLLGAAASEVHLLRVLDANPTEDREAQAAARRQLEAAAGGARGTMVHVAHGPPARRIVETADVLGVDLVAMATHGRSGVGRLLRGSVAEEVLRTARVPLYLATPAAMNAVSEDARFPRILVPLDGSKLADSILPVIVPLATAWKADVVLLHVDVPGEVGVHDVPEVAAKHAQGRAEKHLAGAKASLERQGLTAHVLGAYGAPAEQIVQASERHDATLVAMASHGRTGLARLQFGSVAEDVLRRCRAPLLVRRAAR